jgi:signal transduction histidine kinase
MIAVSISFTLAIVISQRSAYAIREQAASITTNASPSIAHLDETRRELWALKVELGFARSDLEAGRPVHVESLREILDRLTQEWSRYEALPTYGGEQSLQEQVRPRLLRAEDMSRQLADAAARSDVSRMRTVSEADLTRAFAEADDGMHLLLQLNQRESHAAAVAVEELRRSSATTAYALGAAALLLSALLVFIVGRAMSTLSRLQREFEDHTSRERRELAARLRRSERLATLGQVVAEVAHELGTPLNVISGRADLLRRELAGDPSAGDAEAIAHQARRITQIIQRLLNGAQERMPPLESVRVLPVARETANFLVHEAAAAHVSVRVEGNDAVSARANADFLQQVLLNLLQNALQAAGQGSSVLLKVSQVNEEVAIDCIDDGPGVSPEILPRLFEPFATSKPAGQGTGLGLSISRALTRQMGGMLRYVQRERRGAQFRVTLPLSRGTSEVNEAMPTVRSVEALAAPEGSS